MIRMGLAARQTHVLNKLPRPIVTSTTRSGGQSYCLKRRTGMDCRYPDDRDVTLNVILSVWVPGFPADSRDGSGTTLSWEHWNNETKP